jgi:hypothetical protein
MDNIVYLRYLFSNTETTFPLYDEQGTIKPVDKVVWQIKNDNQINRIKETVSSQKFETEIDRFFVINNSYNPLKVETVVNGIIRNGVSKNRLAVILDWNIDKITVSDPCSICHEDITFENCLFTKCGHQFCVHCAIKSCYTQGKCALCRRPLKFEDLYKIIENEHPLGSRYNKMFNLVKDLKGRKVIVLQDKEMVEHSSQLLSKCSECNDEIICCSGGFNMKKEAIHKFNHGSSDSSLLIRDVDLDWIKTAENIREVIFVDNVSNLSNLMSFSFENPVNYHFVIRQSHGSTTNQ